MSTVVWRIRCCLPLSLCVCCCFIALFVVFVLGLCAVLDCVCDRQRFSVVYLSRLLKCSLPRFVLSVLVCVLDLRELSVFMYVVCVILSILCCLSLCLFRHCVSVCHAFHCVCCHCVCHCDVCVILCPCLCCLSWHAFLLCVLSLCFLSWKLFVIVLSVIVSLVCYRCVIVCIVCSCTLSRRAVGHVCVVCHCVWCNYVYCHCVVIHYFLVNSSVIACVFVIVFSVGISQWYWCCDRGMQCCV